MPQKIVWKNRVEFNTAATEKKEMARKFAQHKIIDTDYNAYLTQHKDEVWVHWDHTAETATVLSINAGQMVFDRLMLLSIMTPAGTVNEEKLLAVYNRQMSYKWHPAAVGFWTGMASALPVGLSPLYIPFLASIGSIMMLSEFGIIVSVGLVAAGLHYCLHDARSSHLMRATLIVGGTILGASIAAMIAACIAPQLIVMSSLAGAAAGLMGTGLIAWEDYCAKVLSVEKAYPDAIPVKGVEGAEDNLEIHYALTGISL